MKVYLVWAMITVHGVYTDFAPFESKQDAQEMGINLVQQGKTQDFVIIEGELLHPDEGESSALQELGTGQEKISP